MKHMMPRLLPAFLLVAATGVHAQFLQSLKGGTVAIGATGQFSTPLTSGPRTGTFGVPTASGQLLTETVSNQQQNTTTSAGVLFQLGLHPKPWAGVELNYGYSRYSELYSFNYTSTAATQTLRVPVSTNEATAAYQFHPKHIPLQPFVNIGGGAIDFYPAFANNQWRAAGLVETGLDLPTPNKHIALRLQGRALIYRAPNFTNAAISTRSWRSTEEPSAAIVFRY